MDEMTSPHSVRDQDSEMREIFAFWKRNPVKFCLRNLEYWALESGVKFKESGIPVTNKIQNPSFTDKDWDPVPGIRNSRRGIQNPRLSWIPFHGTNDSRHS